MTPEAEKKIENEVRSIMMRWMPDLPEWDEMTKNEKASLFAEVLKKHKVIWEAFSSKQKGWLIRQMGFNRFAQADGSGNGAGLLIAYLGMARPKLGCGLLLGIVLIILIGIAIQGIMGL